jgi:hypothetical protein
MAWLLELFGTITEDVKELDDPGKGGVLDLGSLSINWVLPCNITGWLFCTGLILIGWFITGLSLLV